MVVSKVDGKSWQTFLFFQQSLRPCCLHQKKGAHVQKFEGVPCFWRFWSHFSTKSFSSQGLSPQTHNKKIHITPPTWHHPLCNPLFYPELKAISWGPGLEMVLQHSAWVHGHAGWQTWWVRSPCRISWILSFKGLKEPQQKNHKSAGFGLQIVIASLIHLRRSYGIPST